MKGRQQELKERRAAVAKRNIAKFYAVTTLQEQLVDGVGSAEELHERFGVCADDPLAFAAIRRQHGLVAHASLSPCNGLAQANT